MPELKTKPTAASVKTFLDAIPDKTKRKDSQALVKLMKKVTKKQPKMWGPSIVGFGSYHYKYASGHEGDSCITGFSPRKDALTIYIVSGFADHQTLLKKLGKHKTGKVCLYVKRLEDVDMGVLETLIERSIGGVEKLVEKGKKKSKAQVQ